MKNEDCTNISKNILRSVVNKDIGVVIADRTGNNSNNEYKHIAMMIK